MSTTPAPPDLRDLHEHVLDRVNEAIDVLTFGENEAPRSERGRRRHAPRYRRIVVAYDGSEGAELALAWAADLAREHGSSILIASAYALPAVTNAAALAYGWYAPFAAGYDEAKRGIEQAAQRAAMTLRASKLDPRVHVLEGSASSQIARLALDHHADLVITGGHRHVGLARLMLGSTATGLLDRAPCSVLVARGPPRPARVLVAADGSSVSHRAVAHALHQASRTGAELIVQHVLEYPGEAGGVDTESILKTVLGRIDLPAAPPQVRYVLDVGRAAIRILERAATEDVGLIAVGGHGKGAIERAIIGSTSRRVANEARASVLVLKEGADG